MRLTAEGSAAAAAAHAARLLVLRVPPAPARLSISAQRHRVEIEELSEAAGSDDIDRRELTYPEVILRLACIRDNHGAYVDYMAERYL